MSVYSVGYVIGSLYTKLRGIKFVGRENLLYDEPVVVIANHTHWADPIYVGLAYPKRKVRFMAKVELFKSKFAAFWLKKLGVFSIDRGNNDIKALKTALQVMKDGDILGIFPEGTRYHEDHELSDFKNGTVLLAIKGKAAVIPMGIRNSERFLGFGKPKPVVNIGKPIRPSFAGFEDKQDALDHWTAECRQAIANLIK